MSYTTKSGVKLPVSFNDLSKWDGVHCDAVRITCADCGYAQYAENHDALISAGWRAVFTKHCSHLVFCPACVQRLSRLIDRAVAEQIEFIAKQENISAGRAKAKFVHDLQNGCYDFLDGSVMFINLMANDGKQADLTALQRLVVCTNDDGIECGLGYEGTQLILNAIKEIGHLRGVVMNLKGENE